MNKSLKPIGSIAFMLVCMLLLSSCTYYTPNPSDSITFERHMEVRRDSRGQVFAICLYEKPVFTKYAKAYERINDYFNSELDGYLYGSYVSKHFRYSWRDAFFDQIDEWVENHGGYETYIGLDKMYDEWIDGDLKDYLMKVESFCTIFSEITYYDSEMVSIRQEYDGLTTGTRSTIEYGYTINMTTGDFYTVADFVTIDEYTFNYLIIDEMRKELGNEWDRYNEKYSIEFFYKYYSFSRYDEFYIDNDYLYIIIYDSLISRDSFTFALPRDSI